MAVQIHLRYRDYSAPRWVRATVERLLSSLPDEHTRGLVSVVLTEYAVAVTREGSRPMRRNRRGVPLGRYHRAWNTEPAWIELIVDEIVTDIPARLGWLRVTRDLAFGRVLFHEIGHHLDATAGSVGRTGENGAERWEARLSRDHFRAHYGYLRPFRPVFRLMARVARQLSRRTDP